MTKISKPNSQRINNIFSHPKLLSLLMALRRAITKRLIDGYRSTGPSTNTKIFRQYMNSPNLMDRIIGIRIESVAPPPKREETTAVKCLSVSDTKKLLRIYQTEKVKARLREIHKSSVSYWEFVQICCETCGNNDEQGSQMAKSLDHSGCVVVLGDVVFLHPHQVNHLTSKHFGLYV